MNAITLLKDDHRTVEKLFVRFEKAGPKAYAAKREIIERIIEELSVHAAIEEQVLYPAVRASVPDLEDETLEALEEHHIVKWVLSELDHLDPEDERYTAKATVLIENVRHHVEEEEDDLFPKVAKALTARQLDDLGEKLDRAKAAAPTHPHPRSPDAPPANLVVGPAAGLADRVTDKVRDFASSAIDRVTGGADDAAAEVSATAQRTASTVKAEAQKTKARTTKAAKTTAGRTAKKATSKARTATKKAQGTATAATRPAKRAARKATTKAKASATRTTKKAKASATRTTKKAKASATRTTKKAPAATRAANRTKAKAKATATTAKRSTRKAA